MTLRRLYTEEMVNVTRPWVTRGHPERRALSRIPALEMLLPEIEQAHEALLEAQVTKPSPERLIELSESLGVCDGRHADVLRGLWYMIRAESYLQRDPDVKAALRRLQNLLLPDGLSSTQSSHLQQVGQAELVSSRLTDADRELLRRIPTMSSNLLDAVDEWIELAAEIARLEHERSGAQPTRSDVVSARNCWIRTMRAVRSVAALVAADNPEVEAIMERLDGMEQQAAERANKRSKLQDEVTAGPDADTDLAAEMQTRTLDMLPTVRRDVS